MNVFSVLCNAFLVKCHFRAGITAVTKNVASYYNFSKNLVCQFN